MSSIDPILIIGGTPQGLQAALTTAHLGRPVTLVEKNAQIPDTPGGWSEEGNRWHQYLRIQVAHHPGIEVLTETTIREIHQKEGGFDVQWVRRPQWVRADLCADCLKCLDACPVVLDDGNKPLFRRFAPHAVSIDKREKAPCRQACPIGMNPQGYVALIAEGRIDEADALIREVNPLPGICGRICHHPCESVCRRQEVDEPVAICALKRFVSDEARKKRARFEPKSLPQGPKVAVIGSGPAGLTASHDLARAGFRPTILEAREAPGGLLRHAIGPYRLPREILDEEISSILSLGTTLRLNMPVRTPDDLDRLRGEGFEAVLLATGSAGDLRLQIEGEDLRGVCGCLAFLDGLWSGRADGTAMGRTDGQSIGSTDGTAIGRLVVIGGGNGAVEAARAGLRAGGEGVTLVCLEQRAEMPAWQHETEAALQEGISIINGLGPRRFIGKRGRVSGIEFKRCTRVFDERGQFNPRYDETDLTTMEADTVVVAIGQERGLPLELPPGEVALYQDGTTSLPGVYACGDAVSGPSTVVEAMASGRKAAQAVISDLRPSEVTPMAANGEGDRGDYEPVPRHMPKASRRPLPQRAVPDRVRDNREVVGPYSRKEAIKEASRCLQCGVCCECLQCEAACGLDAVRHDRVSSMGEMSFARIILSDPAQMNQVPEPSGMIKAGRFGKRDSRAQAVISGRAAALRAVGGRQGEAIVPSPRKTMGAGPRKIGIFICSCNGTLDEDGRLEALTGPAASLPHVAHVEVLASACHPEYGTRIESVMDSESLTGALVASCTCCHLDFVCESCNEQRIRLKDRLFREKAFDPSDIALINIKETCLLPLKDAPEEAVGSALRIIRAGLEQLGGHGARAKIAEESPCRAVVLGATEAGIAAAMGLKHHYPSVVVVEKQTVAEERKQALAARDIAVFTPVRPIRFEGRKGHFVLIFQPVRKGSSGETWTPGHPSIKPGDVKALEEDPRYWALSADIIILGDSHLKQLPHERDPFSEGSTSTSRGAFGSLETGIPGVYMASWPQARTLTQEALGRAAAGEAVEGQSRRVPGFDDFTARVDPEKCRGCGRCAEICPEGAAVLSETVRGVAVSWIDGTDCTGCGNCLATCPTGAIDLPESDQIYYERVTHALLG